MKARRIAVIRLGGHLMCLGPILWQIRVAVTGGLGPDPAETLMRNLGFWGITWLWCSLAMTPLRLLTGQSSWIALRRLLGLWSFAYLLCHLLVFLFLWCGGDTALISEEIIKRPYITLGLVAWILMIPLAVTSAQSLRRMLGRRWNSLHKLVFPVAVLGLLHLIWIEKLDYTKSITFSMLLIFFLFIRFRARQG